MYERELARLRSFEFETIEIKETIVTYCVLLHIPCLHSIIVCTHNYCRSIQKPINNNFLKYKLDTITDGSNINHIKM